MNTLIPTLLCFFLITTSLAQEISDLNGIETQSERTYLFYRNFGQTPYNSVYKFDPETLEDTLFLFGYTSSSSTGDAGVAINDFEFFPNDTINFMNVGNEFNVNFLGTIKRNYTLTFSAPFDMIKVDISKQNPQKVYVGSDNNHLFRSFDGGYTFLNDSSLQFTFLSMSPFNDNTIFGLDGMNRLLKSSDGGYSSSLVDTSRTDDILSSKFFYDSDQQHIYRLGKSYGKNVLWTSNNSGNQFSWTKAFESDFPIYISDEPSTSGHIYLANLRYIYKSTNYGYTFSLFKTFDRRITGIYKKPNSDILFASTDYNIYKITPDTVIVIKSASVPSYIFNFYPLQIGNKWIYNEVTYIDDFPPQIHYDTVIKKVIDDSTAANGKKYFVIKEESNSNPTTYYLERIDSTTGKVYRLNDGFGSPDDEVLIDDLTANLGDTIQSFRIGYWQQDGYTVLKEITNFNKWGLLKKRKIFESYSLQMPRYSLTEGIGLDSSYYSFDFGYTSDYLRGCVIDGVAYGDTVLSVDENSPVVGEYKLFQNYPNPFNPSTKIRFAIPASSLKGEETFVSLKVYDLLGNEVATLVNEAMPAGEYEIEFSSKPLSSGVYFYQLKSGNYVETKKMVFLK
ncbi:MAG: T9SS type A sorting domain-containing protein [Ignavibacterium sp.]